MFEWRVTVSCPVRLVAGDDKTRHGAGAHTRQVYVWTEQHSAVDAYDEALRVVERWPAGTRPVDVIPIGMYVPATTTETTQTADRRPLE